MYLRPTHKALLITVFFFVILITGLLHIYLQDEKEESYFSVDYYFEEEEETEEEETLDPISEIETHRAYNEAQEQLAKLQEQAEAADSEFEKRIQAMEQALLNSEKTNKNLESDPIESYTQSEKVIHNDNVEKNSTVSYYLEDRTATKLPNPVYTCPNSGIIVIHITVNKYGDVIHTTVDNSQSTTSDRCLIDQALEYAKQAKFNLSERSSQNQKGTISYNFIGS